MPARLILNADDFGLTPGINRAVEELYLAGALTSATLMATGPAFEDAVAIALRNPGLGIGCHLVFVDGVPVSHPESIPTLLGADGKGFRPSLADFALSALRGAIQPIDLAREAQAQIQKLQRAGIDVTHIDSHKHTHLFPPVAAAILHAAGRSGIHAFRYPFEPAWSRALTRSAPPLRRLQQSALGLFEPRFRALLDPRSSEPTTQGTLGIAATGTLTAPLLRTLFAELNSQPAGLYELCCHPGYHDAALDQQTTRLRHSREIERLALLEVLPELSRAAGSPALIHYGNLGIPGLQRAANQFAPNTGFEKVL